MIILYDLQGNRKRLVGFLMKFQISKECNNSNEVLHSSILLSDISVIFALYNKEKPVALHLSDCVLQKTEVIDIKWASKEQIAELFNSGCLHPLLFNFENTLP
jgi:hypothetical protein